MPKRIRATLPSSNPAGSPPHQQFDGSSATAPSKTSNTSPTCTPPSSSSPSTDGSASHIPISTTSALRIKLDYRAESGAAYYGPPPPPFPPALDAIACAQLSADARNNPRYLFRAWRDHGNRPSGGHHGLNTEDRITPLYFARHGNNYESALTDHSREDLQQIIFCHLTGIADFFDLKDGVLKELLTIFSSWTPSFQTAYCFSNGDLNAKISIIEVPRLHDTNKTFHVSKLGWLDPMFASFGHEYLVYGPIPGPAHKAVTVGQILDAGVSLKGGINVSALPGPLTPCSSDDCRPITRAEFNKARRVGDLYGGDFKIPVVLALLTLERRCGDYLECGSLPALKMLTRGLRDCRLPREWMEDPSIVDNVVDTTGFGEVKQWLRGIRALVRHVQAMEQE